MFISGGFFPARIPVGTVPQTQGYTQAASPTFKKGYPVVATSGLIDECANTNPASILGVALQDNNTALGYAAANNPTVITGLSNVASVAVANDSTQFVGQLVNNSSTVIAPTLADMEASYGIKKYGTSWRVDKNLTSTNARVVITGIDTTYNLVYFKFLKANQQQSA